MYAAARIYEHPDFAYSLSHEWKERRTARIISSSAFYCVAAVSVIAFIVAASTFGVYNVSTLASLKSIIMVWQDSVIRR